jgi:hypothetical protein
MRHKETSVRPLGGENSPLPRSRILRGRINGGSASAPPKPTLQQIIVDCQEGFRIEQAVSHFKTTLDTRHPYLKKGGPGAFQFLGVQVLTIFPAKRKQQSTTFPATMACPAFPPQLFDPCFCLTRASERACINNIYMLFILH